MRFGSFVARFAVAALILTSACQTASTPNPTVTQTSPPTPATQASPTPEPSREPAPTAPQPTDTPAAPPTPATTGSGNADVRFVRAVLATNGTWTFHVTVEHPDTGWEDYADGWDVVTLDGEVLRPDADSPFTRLLLHPHENEQPFTRSQSGIVIPDGVTQVRVRAHDLVDGYGGREVLVDLTAPSGPDFEVER